MAVLPPQGGGITLVVIVSVFVPLVIASTTLRLWARRLKHKNLEINDYAAIVATVPRYNPTSYSLWCYCLHLCQIIAVAYAFLTLSGKAFSIGSPRARNSFTQPS